ncbi:MAG TPA: UvrD-helicase domain-containing protein [Polyangia bacterium]|jgi:DNA helicase-2/ATP-dependent DNA helicase PcrA|nr:UvrD-helicase domain-containing protein [Polyangia bacterium]
MEAAPTASEPAEKRPQPFSAEILARELNPAQLEAVLHPPGPMVVVAGAGSGKTRVITYRLARLVATGADPRRIVAVTFTNKAAGELRERVDKLLWERMKVGSRGLWVGTFHAISARILRQWGESVGLRKDFVIYDDDDQKRLLGRVLTDLKVPERMFPVRQVLSAIDKAKNSGIAAASFNSDDYFDDVVGKAYRLYEERLAAANATDFGGLLMKTLTLVAGDSPAAQEIGERFDHVLVDEFQDTNSVQYRLVRLLAKRTDSITVVGDEDQSIYRWRGADIRNILDFERDHPGAFVVKLEQNYRSTGNILRAANAIIEKNTERRPKRLFTETGDGDPIVVFEGETERDEAEFVVGRIEAALSTTLAPRDFAVFYRTNAQSRVLEDALRARDLPYSVVGGTRFFDRAEIKNLISYLRAIANPDDGLALQRIVNVPARGIGSTTADKIGDLVYERKISAWQALELVSTDEALLGSGPRKKVAAFVELMRRLRIEGAGLGPASLAEKVLEESGYRDALAGEATMEAEGRIENLLELVAQMREYEREAEEPTLHGFLERVALASDVDGYDPEKGAVSLMTVHTAKGLEFPIVFITGLEERIFPHARSVDDDSAVEEERRLCYVAVTRARTLLHLSRVRRRRLSGQELPGIPSRFLRDLPVEGVEQIITARPPEYGAYGTSEGRGPWGGRWSRDEEAPPSFARRDEFAHLPPGRSRAPAPGLSAPRATAARTTAARTTAARTTPGEIVVEYDTEDSAASPGLQVGAKLRHPSFGVGEVRAWQGAGAEMKVTMKFAGAGVKTILARFLSRP